MRRIYLKGDIGDPSLLEMWDADTHERLDVPLLGVRAIVGPSGAKDVLVSMGGVEEYVEIIPNPGPQPRACCPTMTNEHHLVGCPGYLTEPTPVTGVNSPPPPLPATCPDCGGSGEIQLLNKVVPCERCRP